VANRCHGYVNDHEYQCGEDGGEESRLQPGAGGSGFGPPAHAGGSAGCQQKAQNGEIPEFRAKVDGWPNAAEGYCLCQLAGRQNVGLWGRTG
jgi:hypothetical protein